jgi:hypothetical protein
MGGDKYLVLGHPRCGTGYSAELFKSYGLNIGHERMGSDGISCWQYVIKDDLPQFSKKDLNNKNRNQYNFDKIVHTIRDPFTALPSIYYTETPTGANPKHWSYKFILQSHKWRKEKLELSDTNPFEFVAQSFLKWNELIENDSADIILKIESPDKLISYLEDTLKLKKIGEAKKFYNSRKYDNKFQWRKISPTTISMLDKFCDKYNYEKISKRLQ